MGRGDRFPMVTKGVGAYFSGSGACGGRSPSILSKRGGSRPERMDVGLMGSRCPMPWPAFPGGGGRTKRCTVYLTTSNHCKLLVRYWACFGYDVLSMMPVSGFPPRRSLQWDGQGGSPGGTRPVHAPGFASSAVALGRMGWRWCDTSVSHVSG